MSSSCALAYTPTCGPTAVGHCATAQLTRGAERSLVIARSTVLEVYSLHVVASTAATPAREQLEGVGEARLVPTLRSELFGRIEDLAVVRLPGAARDVLLLAFADAKLSIVEVDEATLALRTRAVYSFDALGDGVGCIEASRPPVLRAHPQGQCCAMLAHASLLVVLPLRGIGGASVARGGATAAAAAAGGGAKGTAAWWSAPLPALDLAHARELVFLNGHVDPTALVLAEPLQSWAATGSRANTCQLRALGVDAAARETRLVWTLDGLPYDCHTLVPLPEPPGGALVLSDSALFWANQAARYALALSSDARCASIPLRAAPLALSLRDAAIALVTPDGAASSSPLRAVLSTAHGDLFVLTLRTDGRGVCAIDFLRVASSVPASTICALGDARGSTFIFLGSRVADSLLLQLGLRAADGGRRAAAPAIGGAAKRLRADDGDGGDGDDALEEDDEEDRALFGAAAGGGGGGLQLPVIAGAAGGGVKKLPLLLRDSLVSPAPISDLRVTRGAGTAAATGADDDAADSGAAVLMCGGRGRSGSLSVATVGVRLSLVADFEVEPCEALYTVAGAAADRSLLLLSTARGSRLLAASRDEGAISLREISAKSGLERAAPTLLFAPLLGGAFAAQVTAGSVRLLRADTDDAPPCLHELTPPAGRTAARASATDQMVLVLLDDGTPWLLRTDAGADGSATLVEEAAPPTPTPSLVAASVFYDRSGLFAPATAAAERADANMAAAGAAADAAGGGAAEGDGEESEDEDDLALYGRAPEKAAAEPAATAAEVPEEGVEAAEASVVCVACGASGELLMYALPAWTLLFTAPAVAHAPHVLANALAAEPSATPAAGAAAAAAVLEVRLCAFAHAEWAPLLAVLVGSRQLYVYRTTAAAAAPADGGAAVRFVRLPIASLPPAGRSTTTTTRRRRRCRCRRCRLSSCACRNSAPAPAPARSAVPGWCSVLGLSSSASSAVARGRTHCGRPPPARSTRPSRAPPRSTTRCARTASSSAALTE